MLLGNSIDNSSNTMYNEIYNEKVYHARLTSIAKRLSSHGTPIFIVSP